MIPDSLLVEGWNDEVQEFVASQSRVNFRDLIPLTYFPATP
jgi:hypothetical protein